MTKDTEQFDELFEILFILLNPELYLAGILDKVDLQELLRKMEE